MRLAEVLYHGRVALSGHLWQRARCCELEPQAAYTVAHTAGGDHALCRSHDILAPSPPICH